MVRIGNKYVPFTDSYIVALKTIVWNTIAVKVRRIRYPNEPVHHVDKNDPTIRWDEPLKVYRARTGRRYP